MKENSYPQATCSASPKIQLSLNDRSMTLLHRAGVTGLGMTLKQLERRYPSPSQRVGQLDWSLSSHSISLYWEGADLAVLDWLLKESFQINEQGILCLTGLETQGLHHHSQIAIHQGITSTFLQHNKVCDSRGQAPLVLEINGRSTTVWYKRVATYAHQSFAKRLCDQNGCFLQEPIRIAGWLYPGAVRTHNAFGVLTRFESTPEHALALLFAPVACWYFMLPIDAENETVRCVLVIPEVDDLVTHAEGDREIRSSSYENFWAANLGDAGLKFLALQAVGASATDSRVRRCQCVLFGKTKWAKQQIVRTRVETIKASQETLLHYQSSCQYLPQNEVCNNEGKTAVTVSATRGMIAANLAQGSPWWFRFFEKATNKNIAEDMNSEKEGLWMMIEESEWEDQSKKLFVKACHEALRRIYAKIYDQTPKGDYARIERRNIRIRSELGRCKNAMTLRSFISRFFAEAGQIPILQEHWEALLPITTGESDWRITRDLTLLALASYKKSGTAESNISSATTVEAIQPNSETAN
jgi:CRISPR-associated protein Cas8a1/Csx13